MPNQTGLALVPPLLPLLALLPLHPPQPFSSLNRSSKQAGGPVGKEEEGEGGGKVRRRESGEGPRGAGAGGLPK